MVRRFFISIQPYIIPEFLFLFTRMIPAALFLAFFIFISAGPKVIRDDFKVWGLGILLCIGGIYIMRIFGWLIFRMITQVQQVKPEVFSEEDLRKQKKKR